MNGTKMSEAQNPVEEAMAAAQKAAANVAPEATGQVPATAQRYQAPAPTDVVPTTPQTMDDAAANAGADKYLSVKEDGMKIGESSLMDSIDVFIDLASVRPLQAMKYNGPNGVAYHHSIDNGNTDVRTGRSWAALLAEAKHADPKFTGPYPTAEIPMTVEEDLKDPKGGAVLVEVGDVLGYTPSTTGFKPFAQFWKKMSRDGLTDREVKVRITTKKRTNAKGQTWGVAQFEHLPE